jgi:hypothetical protein
MNAGIKNPRKIVGARLIALLLIDLLCKFQMASDSRFKEYTPDSPLTGFGFFSCLE